MADIKYIVTADTKGAVKGIDKVGTSIGGMKTQAQKSVSPLKGMFTQLAAGLVATIVCSSPPADVGHTFPLSLPAFIEAPPKLADGAGKFESVSA